MKEEPGATGIFIDFDGTLAPIVNDPELARPLPGSVDVLARLSARYRRVAVVSGRPVEYLAEHLSGAGETQLVGLYGLERLVAGRATVEVPPEAERWREPVEKAATEAERRVSEDSGRLGSLRVERKGLTVTLHYRDAPQLATWVQAFGTEQSSATGLIAHAGKMSLELRPPVSTDKGTVVSELAEGLSALCYLGDDVGDLPAFDTLNTLRVRGLLTLAVAVRSGIGDETPEQVVAAADMVIDGPEGTLRLLSDLAD